MPQLPVYTHEASDDYARRSSRKPLLFVLLAIPALVLVGLRYENY